MLIYRYNIKIKNNLILPSFISESRAFQIFKFKLAPKKACSPSLSSGISSQMPMFMYPPRTRTSLFRRTPVVYFFPKRHYPGGGNGSVFGHALKLMAKKPIPLPKHEAASTAPSVQSSTPSVVQPTTPSIPKTESSSQGTLGPVSNFDSIKDKMSSALSKVATSLNTHAKSAATGLDPALEKSKADLVNQYLRRAEEMGIVKYENTHEYSKAGDIRLTSIGRDLQQELIMLNDKLNYNVTQANCITYTEDSSVNSKVISSVIYKVGLLKVHPSTLILTAKHTHIIVIGKQMPNNTVRIVGFLTSHKSPINIKLSDNQASNPDKAQYLVPALVPSIVDEANLLPCPNAKVIDYIQREDIQLALQQYEKKRDAELSQVNLKYMDTQGIIEQDLAKMIDLHVINEAKKLEIKVKPSNFQTAEKEKADANKKAKMLANQQKQKLDAAEAKLKKNKP